MIIGSSPVRFKYTMNHFTVANYMRHFEKFLKVSFTVKLHPLRIGKENWVAII